MLKKWLIGLVIVLPLLLIIGDVAFAQGVPKIDLSISPVEGKDDYSIAIQTVILLTILSFGPAFITMMTSFTRIVIVFFFMRTALGTQQSPPNQVLIGLALFLTIYIMMPVFNKINDVAIQPYLSDQITQAQALERGAVPLKEFMLKQTREKDVLLFMDLANLKTVGSVDDMPLYVVVPAYVISELRIAFQIGFLIYLPFLVVDLVVSSVLLAMGVMFLPPVLVSLPFKILIFVLTDGWYLLVDSLVRSFK
ncbi:flagellar biosynthetic protein FliP [bacterium]|nr:MAG: flagellar biosynthetic protein FliP [bacterium]